MGNYGHAVYGVLAVCAVLWRTTMKISNILCGLILAGMVVPAVGQQSGSGSLINIQVSQNIPTVNYWTRGSTNVGFVGTALLPRATGQAKVGAQKGSLQIQGDFKGLDAPTNFGPEYLVYVLWAITPEGRATNLGQLMLNNQKSKVDVTTKLQTFGMMVTAEPYFAVSFPSQKVVLANTVLSDTKGAVAEVNANMELLQRGTYSDPGFQGFAMQPNVPLDLYQAENAVRIAKLEGAEKYAPDALAKAQSALTQAETYQAHKQKNSVPTVARQAVQAAEDARSIAVKREQQDKIAAQQLASQQAQQAAQAAQEKAQAQAAQERALAAQQAAQQKAAAELAAAKAAEAQAATQAAADAAKAQALSAQAAAAKALADKEALRERLLAQFNRVLPTTDTPRGLVVNMGDVLFNTGKADLQPPAQIALARLAGILSSYPSLHLSIEGYTDSTGGADLNQKLSEKRADAVQTYLAGQALPLDSMTATGLGDANPVADNTTAAGRQKNRRVEIVISGEVIGSKIGQ
jgi:outer membrane protein OmpA-like peptidoglycan-associated protein